MALWTQAAHDAALKEKETTLNLHLQVELMGLPVVQELLMHAQLMELWITDVLQLKDSVEIPCGYPSVMEKKSLTNRSSFKFVREPIFGRTPGRK